jgi:hypothetical protein
MRLLSRSTLGVLGKEEGEVANVLNPEVILDVVVGKDTWRKSVCFGRRALRGK